MDADHADEDRGADNFVHEGLYNGEIKG